MSRSKLVSSIIKFVLVCSVIPGLVINVFAATQAGNGGASYGGATVNTFAAGMPLTEVYFIADKFNNDPDVVEIVSNPNNALSLEGKVMYLLNDSLEPKKNDYDIHGSYRAIYRNAAILQDGTTADVTATMELGKIITGSTVTSDSDSILIPDKTSLYNFLTGEDRKGINISTTLRGNGKQSKNGISFSIGVEQKITLNVNASGDFIVPINGLNQNRNAAGSFAGLHTSWNNEGYQAAIETAILPDNNNIFYPTYGSTATDSYVTTDSGMFIFRGGPTDYYKPPHAEGVPAGKTSVYSDRNYMGGFAALGTSGFQVTMNSASGSNHSDNSPFGNNQFIVLGDLVHRIWSGSGVGGTIKTDKNGDGTGTELDGGSFTGTTIPTGFPAGPDTLKRYVIPDAKAGVTYTMTPDTDYVMDKVVVDGNELTPGNPTEGKTWTLASTDGDGTLTYSNGIYTYSFDKPNTQDHEIYVTWIKKPTGADAETYGAKGATQKGTPTFTKGTGDIPTTGAYTLLDASGNPVDTITIAGQGKYTINKDTGEVTFEPEANFVGDPTPAVVQVTDVKGLTAKANYIPHVIDNVETKEMVQTIKYVYEDGSPVKDKSGNPIVNIRKQTYTRTGTVDPTTGAITYPDWTPVTFDAIPSPTVEGYTPSKSSIPGGNFTPANWPGDENVVYRKPATPTSAPVTPKKPTVPDTSDHTDILQWSIVMTVATVVMILSERTLIKCK